MRVLVLGGTRFIGRAIVEELVASGHDVTLVHRGVLEPDDMPQVAHIHVAREWWAAEAWRFSAVEPDSVIDCLAMSADDARAAIAAIAAGVHTVVLSSQDVYRAFSSLNAGRDTDSVPIDETSSLSVNRFPHRGSAPEHEVYSKQDVEDQYLARGAVVLRLPAVFGEHDHHRREDFILRRVRARRRTIQIGAGGFLWTRGWVRDIARGARLAAEQPAHAGEVFNIGEQTTWSMRLWVQRILEAAQSDAELVEVADEAIPEDMSLTSGRLTQHVLVDTSKARALLGYSDSDAMTAVRSSVGWHLSHPPPAQAADFSADDAALGHRLPPRRSG